jgi:hypothetical protein
LTSPSSTPEPRGHFLATGSKPDHDRVHRLSQAVLAEATGEFLGNVTQAFRHIGPINAAWTIPEAERREAETHRLTSTTFAAAGGTVGSWR